MFKAQILIVYVDPEDKSANERVLKNLVDLRKDFPVNLKQSPDGEFDVDKKNDVLFVITHSANMMFY